MGGYIRIRARGEVGATKAYRSCSTVHKLDFARSCSFLGLVVRSSLSLFLLHVLFRKPLHADERNATPLALAA